MKKFEKWMYEKGYSTPDGLMIEDAPIGTPSTMEPRKQMLIGFMIEYILEKTDLVPSLGEGLDDFSIEGIYIHLTTMIDELE